MILLWVYDSYNSHDEDVATRGVLQAFCKNSDSSDSGSDDANINSDLCDSDSVDANDQPASGNADEERPLSN